MDDLVKDYNTNAPEGVNNMWYVVPEHDAMKTLKLNMWVIARQSVSRSILMVFILQLILNRNIIVSILTTIAVASNLYFMMNQAAELSDEYELVRSSSIILSIGLQVHWCVQLGDEYTTALPGDKKTIIRKALSNSFGPILGSFICLYISCVFFFNFRTLPFRQYAMIYMSAAFMSFLGSTIFLTALLAAFGPSTNKATIGKMWSAWKKKDKIAGVPTE